MTPSEIRRIEEAEITQRTGRYIPPHRMALLLQSASKIADLLTSADVYASYEESMIVLDIVRGAILVATRKGE